MKIIQLFLLLGTMLFGGIEMYGQVMKAADLEKYAKQKYGDKWLEAAMNIGSGLTGRTEAHLLESPGDDTCLLECHPRQGRGCHQERCGWQ